ncbi:response regulator [Dokdonella sp.]|uniref:response regulator n=1 Tax=Dokdonella sp. TaxID=2291710 RepID=UPI001B078012|nr:response regulator [Dokdonella sp.]MBO9663472.1 response regulator [Dokdonella sp.]
MPRVLVADDNPLSLHFFAEALRTLGCVAEMATDGADALRRANASRFEVLLLDARMPGLDGAEVLARLRAGAGLSRRAVAIATTAAAEARIDADLLAAGFVDVLHKPLTVAELRAALARHSIEPAPPDPAPALDDARALAAAGGDATIVSALRGLLAAELDALPSEMAAIAAARDADALRQRLHKLDASAGFCGAPALGEASASLRTALQEVDWPDHAVARFLRICTQVRALLA